MNIIVSKTARRAMALKPQDSYADPPVPGAAGKRMPLNRAKYDGVELRPFEGRVGAMTAYGLPSKGNHT